MTIKDVPKLIANKDRVVYKLVLLADADCCLSLIRLFPYFTEQEKEPVKLVIHSNKWRLMAIFEGYHSYTRIDNSYVHKSGFFQVNGVSYQLNPKQLNQDIYIAKFVIPKGSEYYVNACGEVVSNSIKYTGEFQLVYKNPYFVNNIKRYDKIKLRRSEIINPSFRLLGTRFSSSSIS